MGWGRGDRADEAGVGPGGHAVGEGEPRERLEVRVRLGVRVRVSVRVSVRVRVRVSVRGGG